ncbi:MAG TPA: hypothetical protein DEU95_08530 [Chloroflexi bacterium]|nr:hypothetical protein [Chloroflexota bacterium]
MTRDDAHNWTGTRLTSAIGALYGGSKPDAPFGAVIDTSVWQHLRPAIVERGWQQHVITAVKLAHTLIFLILSSLIVWFAWSGLRGRWSRRMGLALASVGVEAVVITTNGGRCPLTGIVEDLGAERGTVSDIFLPRWAARRIPHISSSLVLLGLLGLAAHRLARR